MPHKSAENLALTTNSSSSPSNPAGAKISAPQQMASSCAGACLVSLFMTPLDVVKIRLQAQDLVFERRCFLYSNGLMDHLCQRLNGDPPPTAMHTKEEICNCRWYNRPKYFNGTFDAMIKISRTEGVTSLWSGLSPTLVLAVPTTVIYFTSYEQLKLAMRRGMDLAPLWASPSATRQDRMADVGVSTAAGGVARAFATTLVSPLEMVRTKMQSKKMAFWQIREALALTVRREGVLALWKGYAATMLRDVPFSALYWPFYEAFRSALLGSDPVQRARLPQSEVTAGTFAAGAVAGSIAATITLPMDVIKTRRQIELGETELFVNGDGSTGQRRKAPGTLEIARNIARSQGASGLFSGLTPRILKIAPACAIMISSYEFCKNFFRRWNTDRDGGGGKRQTLSE